MPKPDEAATGGSGGASAIGTGGGASTTGSTQPPAGAWAVVAALAAVVADEPHNAVAEACDPKMLSATIGLIVRAWADVAEADANAGLAQSATATPNVVTVLITPLNIKSLPIEKRSHR